MKCSILLVVLFALFLCSTTRKEIKFNVEYRGIPKNIVHKGDISAQSNLLTYRT